MVGFNKHYTCTIRFTYLARLLSQLSIRYQGTIIFFFTLLHHTHKMYKSLFIRFSFDDQTSII